MNITDIINSTSTIYLNHTVTEVKTVTTWIDQPLIQEVGIFQTLINWILNIPSIEYSAILLISISLSLVIVIKKA